MSTLALTPRPDVRIGTARPRPVRLTRRGRLVLTVLFTAVLLVALVAFGAGSAATGGRGAVPTRTVVVSEGDTVWAIASSVVADGEDPREMVHRIIELNALPSASLVEGQRLAVPAG